MKDRLIGFIESLNDGTTIRKVVSFVILLLQIALVALGGVSIISLLGASMAMGAGYLLVGILAAALSGITAWLCIIVLGYRKARIREMEPTGFVILPLLAHLCRGIGECNLLVWTITAGISGSGAVLVALAGGGAAAVVGGLVFAIVVFPIGLLVGATLGFLSLFFWYMIAELFTMVTAIVENTRRAAEVLEAR